VGRLAEDHAHAERLARGLAGCGFEVEPVQTNMVFVKVAADRCAALQERLRAAGVVAIVSPRTRLVTHLDVDAAAITRAVDAFAAFQASSAAAN